jgi:hypothetical protein
MNRRGVVIVAVFAILVGLAVVLVATARPARVLRPSGLNRKDVNPQDLFRQLQPEKLKNCDLERFGEQNDGGYLLCANLLSDVKSAYSYGISGYDGWGCEVSRTLGVPVHQYDCFNLTRPMCEGGNAIFHGECIGTVRALQKGRPFDSLAGQIARNGDAGKRLVVKIDVEGAEWDSFNDAPEDVLQRIDQMAVEFHGFDRPQFLEAIVKLKRLFHVAHLHWNNYSCLEDQAPFPAWAYEVLFVNKRIGVLDPAGAAVLPNPADAPNTLDRPDCQVVTEKPR